MNLEERAGALQKELERALQEGTSQGNIHMYESTIAELVRINDWILEQCQENNRVYFEDSGRKYILFKNTTGINFRFFAMKIKIIDNEKVVDTYEVTASNWMYSKWQRLYFDAQFNEGNILRIDINSIEYYVMNGKSCN